MKRRAKENVKRGMKWVAGLVLVLIALYPLLPRGARGEPWDRWPSPEAAGYSAPGLKAVTDEARRLGTTGLVVVKGGKVLLEFGDIEARGYMAAGRYSIAAMVFGKPVTDGLPSTVQGKVEASTFRYRAMSGRGSLKLQPGASIG